MTYALTHSPSPSINHCELTFLERRPIDYEKAVSQHAAYCTVLRDNGIEVVNLNVNSAFPDCSFIEDTAVILDELAVICSPSTPSRRNEIETIKKEITKYRPIRCITLPATLDGGDVLPIDRMLFVGQSRRTNRLGFESLQRFVSPSGYRVLPIDVADALHLKTACTALSGRTLLMNPNWIDEDIFRGYEIIKVAASEPFAANTLRLPQRILMNAAAPMTIQYVVEAGFNVTPIDISEFSKAEAGLTCMSILFEDQPFT